jgi:hypothetical protein
VCIIREGEKYLFVKANYCLKFFEDVHVGSRMEGSLSCTLASAVVG